MNTVYGDSFYNSASDKSGVTEHDGVRYYSHESLVDSSDMVPCVIIEQEGAAKEIAIVHESSDEEENSGLSSPLDDEYFPRVPFQKDYRPEQIQAKISSRIREAQTSVIPAEVGNQEEESISSSQELRGILKPEGDRSAINAKIRESRVSQSVINAENSLEQQNPTLEWPTKEKTPENPVNAREMKSALRKILLSKPSSTTYETARMKSIKEEVIQWEWPNFEYRNSKKLSREFRHIYKSENEYRNFYKEILLHDLQARVEAFIKQGLKKQNLLPVLKPEIKISPEQTLILVFSVKKSDSEFARHINSRAKVGDLLLLLPSRSEGGILKSTERDGPVPMVPMEVDKGVVCPLGVIDSIKISSDEPEPDMKVSILTSGTHKSGITQNILSQRWKLLFLLNISIFEIFNNNLRNLEQIHLIKSILKPNFNKRIAFTDPFRNQVKKQLMLHRFHFDENQIDAIATAARHHAGFTIIQGRAGTGKTTTVVGIVKALLMGKPSQHRKGHDLGANRYAGMETVGFSNYTSPILLITKTISALNELLGRLLSAHMVELGSGTKAPGLLIAGVQENQLENPEWTKFLVGGVQQDKSDYGSKHTLVAQIESLTIDIRKLEKNFAMNKDAIMKKKKIRSEMTAQLRLRSEERSTVRSSVDNSKTIFAHLEKAQVVLTNIIGIDFLVKCFPSGTDLFETIIFDEAEQVLELNALTPLQFGCKYCIMVGDDGTPSSPSVSFEMKGNDRTSFSLFTRLINGSSDDPLNLAMQHRMPYEVSQFVTKEFEKKPFESQKKFIRDERFHFLRNKDTKYMLGPFFYYDLKYSFEEGGRNDLHNPGESKLICLLISYIREMSRSNMATSSRIGVITQFNGQKARIKGDLARMGDAYNSVVVDSLDGFMGKEFDFIFVSMTRGTAKQQALSSNELKIKSAAQFLYYSLSRAKYSFIFVGNSALLCGEKIFRSLRTYARNWERFCSDEIDKVLDDVKKTLENIPKRHSIHSIKVDDSPSMDPRERKKKTEKLYNPYPFTSNL